MLALAARLLHATPPAAAAYSHAEASGALDIHKEAVWRLYQPLELVLGPLQLSWRVEQVYV